MPWISIQAPGSSRSTTRCWVRQYASRGAGAKEGSCSNQPRRVWRQHSAQPTRAACKCAHADALATTDRFWPVAAHSHNPREGWWLTLSRAVVLASNGRLHDADELIARIRQDSDAEKDAIVRIENEGFAADLALARGDYTNSAALAKSALTPELETTNWQDYAGTWSTLIRALQRGGQVAAAADEIARFRTWAGKDDRRSLYVALADADQARLENRSAAAIQLYADAMAKAERLAIPEDMRKPITLAILAVLSGFAAPSPALAATPPGYKLLAAKGALRAGQAGAELLQDYGSFALYRVPTPSVRGADGDALTANAEADTLQFTAQPFDTQRGTLAPPAPFSLQAAPGASLQVVQFVGPLKKEWLDALVARGVKPVQYVASHARSGRRA